MGYPLIEQLPTVKQYECIYAPLGDYIRIGVAGGPGKVEPILGALRGGFINILVTDNYAATQLRERA
jgi:hypothetical protein